MNWDISWSGNCNDSQNISYLIELYFSDKKVYSFESLTNTNVEINYNRSYNKIIITPKITFTSTDELLGQSFSIDYNKCVYIKPIVENFNCTTCRDYTPTNSAETYHVAYRGNAIFTFNLRESGDDCMSTDIAINFYGDGDSYSNAQGAQKIEIPMTYSLDQLATQKPETQHDANDYSFKVTGYNYNEFGNTIESIIYITNLRKCIVPELIANPIFLDNNDDIIADPPIDYSIANSNFIIKFRGVTNLYSPCFGGISYYKFYTWTSNSEEQLSGTITVDSKYNKDKDSFTFSLKKPAIYKYRIVAFNVLEEITNSTIGILNVCPSDTNTVPLPKLQIPQQGGKNITVDKVYFEWQSNDELQALRCSTSESAYIVIELESSDTYERYSGPQTSIASVSMDTTSFTLRNQLLALSTQYYWRISVYHFKPNNQPNNPSSTRADEDEEVDDDDTSGTEIRYSSSINTFMTVAKHCAYTNCNHGHCLSESVTCQCYSEYRGEFCDITGLTSGTIVLIVTLTAIFLILILIGIFIFLKKSYFLGLKIPDLSKYMFIMPGHVEESNEQIPIDQLQEIIKQDISNNFQFAINLLANTPITDADNVCRSIIYAYESQGAGLLLLLNLIQYEVYVANTATTLFRSNSYATKCFKYYARMIGLPYLFRVIYPLINKLIVDEQKINNGISLEGNEKMFDGADMTSYNSVSYELNEDKFLT